MGSDFQFWLWLWYELVVVAGDSMTGQIYRDDIVIPHIEEYAHNFGAAFVLMHDNATISYCQDCKRRIKLRQYTEVGLASSKSGS
jgi:hypothetical protein